MDNDSDNDNSIDYDSNYGNDHNDNNIQTPLVSFMAWRQLIRFSVNYVPQTFSNFAKNRMKIKPIAHRYVVHELSETNICLICNNLDNGYI